MRATILAFTAAAALATLAAPAAAGPASVTASEGCFAFLDYEVCSTWRTVAQQVETPSGNAKWTFHSTSDYAVTYLPTGEVVNRGSSRWHDHALVKNGEVQVLHLNSRSEFSFAGITCTSRFAYQFTNGELRHDSFSTICE